MNDETSRETLDLPLRTRIAFALITVVIVLAALETGLRMIGVQPTVATEDPFVGFAGSADLFERTTLQDGTVQYVTTPSKRTYFNVQAFPSEKDPRTTRIFCLGGSTTYGRPYSDPTSFAGWLRALLPEADPRGHYEVVNAGGISYASYRVARVVEEILDYEPDILVVYTGHNEFLEERTYGEVRDRSPLLRHALDLVNRTRIGALATRLVGGAEQPVDGRTILPTEVQARLDHSAGLDLYERDDAMAANVRGHYETALRNIVTMTRNAGVRLVLVTPASNVSDFSPFKAEPTDGLDAATVARAQAALEASRMALDAGDVATAVRAASEAVALDPRNPLGHYDLARALEAAGRVEEAAAEYRCARDEDVCTLRAPTDFARIVLEVGRDTDTPVVDYVSFLSEEAIRRTGAPLVGDEFFLDHVHPTIEGHRLLAELLIDRFAAEHWMELASTYDDEAIARVAARVEAAVSDEEHARALANLSLTLSWAGKAEDSRRLAQRALEAGVEDPTILFMAARHATLAGEHEEARGYYRRAVKAAPNDATTRSQMGFFLAGTNQHEAAVAQFYLASLMWSDNETFHQQLGFAFERVRRPDLALAAFETALRLSPQDTKLKAKVGALSAVVPADARFGDLTPQVERHPTGYPKSLVTTRAVNGGERVPDGFRVDWYDTGELKEFAPVRRGADVGVVVRWDREGREVERVDIGS